MSQYAYQDPDVMSQAQAFASTAAQVSVQVEPYSLNKKREEARTTGEAAGLVGMVLVAPVARVVQEEVDMADTSMYLIGETHLITGE